MAQGKVEKKHLKTRILRNLFIIMAICMFISTVASYIYFEKVVREQKIAEEVSRLSQASNQIKFMVEDIENFTKGILVDEDLLEALEDGGESTFDVLKQKDRVGKRLQFYNALRTYIRGSFLELEDENWFTSSTNFPDKNYQKQKETIPQVAAYREAEEQIFSNPYYGIDNWVTEPLTCYRAKMMDIHHYGEKRGTLYLEISFPYFLEQLENYGEAQDNVCLVGNGGEILYEKNPESPIRILLEKREISLTEGISQGKEGYFICQDIREAGWKLCTFITREYLWQKCSFVPAFFFLSFLLSITAILFTTSRLMERTVRPITALSERMKTTDYEKLHTQEIADTGDEIQTLYECYNRMVQEIQRGMEERMNYEKQKKEMEFDILLSQINPHYLYNVLNTVVYLSAAGKNKEVVRIANSLIFSLQETLKLGEKTIETTIQKELELTECYLGIQKYRYPDLFAAELVCEEELKDYLVPKTIIQPLVENAILHGILPSEKKGTVRVEIFREKQILCIEVRDDGVGIEEQPLKLFEERKDIVYEKNGRKHIGISNVRDRISHFYGEPYGMWIQKGTEGGTRVRLYLPLRKGEAKSEQNLSIVP